MKKLLCFLFLIAPSIEGMDRLQYAITSTYEQLLHILNLRDYKPELLQAVRAGDKKRLLELLKIGVDVNFTIPDQHGSPVATPLMEALRDPELVQILLDNGADVTFQSVDGWTPLSRAVTRPQVVRLLLEAQKAGKLNPPLDVNRLCDRGRTALHCALEAAQSSPCREACLHSALQLSSFANIDPNITNDSDQNYPLHSLRGCLGDPAYASSQHPLIMFNLIERGAMIECRNKELETPLEFLHGAHDRTWPLFCVFGATCEALGAMPLAPAPEAPIQGTLSGELWKKNELDKAGIDGLLKDGACMDGEDPYTSLTPCMILAAQGRVDDLKTILKWYPHIDLNARCCNGWHALHFAAYNGHAPMMEFLLSLEAIDVLPRTVSGLSAYDLAQIGANARAQARSAEPDLSVCQVFDKFYAHRFAALVGLYRIKKTTPLPKDVILIITRLYRL